jgi:hypothetical protein
MDKKTEQSVQRMMARLLAEMKSGQEKTNAKIEEMKPGQEDIFFIT